MINVLNTIFLSFRSKLEVYKLNYSMIYDHCHHPTRHETNLTVTTSNR